MAALVSGLIVVAVVFMASLAQANSGSIDLHNNTAESGGGCPDTNNAYWHFVLTPNNTYSFGAITLNLGSGSPYVFTPPADLNNPNPATEWIPNGSQTDNVFVKVPAGKTLLSLQTAGSSAIWNDTTQPNRFNLSHVCTGKINADLTVRKTASPSYTRTHKWTIDKRSDTDTVYSAGGGESGAVNYTVAVTKTGSTDGDFAVSGKITVSNPNAFDVKGVTLSDTTPGGTCAVTPNSVDLTAGASATADYTCSFASNPGSGTNTATATWPDIGSPHTSANGTADYTFAGLDPTTVVDDTIDVTDTNGKSWQFSDSGSVSYSESFTDPAGVCTKHTNTATITQTGLSDSVTVEDCQGADLTVSKTANPAFSRAYKWNISKSVDKTKVNILGGTATFNYTVTVAHDNGTDSGWTVTGKITVSNPNTWQDVTADVTDAIPGGTCSVSGGSSVVVPRSDSKTFDYSCTFAWNPGSGRNTATASWDKDAAHTPSASASGTADFAFGAPTSVTDECVNVNDSFANSLGTVCVVDGNPKAFTYSRDINAPNLGTCQSYDNTATFTTNDTGTIGSASKTVSVCSIYNALTPGYWKNHLAITGSAGCKELKYGGCSNNGPWAKQYLPQSLGSFSVSSIGLAGQIFDLMNCGTSKDQDAVGCTAGHLLATKLNFANGSPHATCIDNAVSDADAFLISINYTGPGKTYALSATQRSQAIALKTKLDNYNNGKGC